MLCLVVRRPNKLGVWAPRRFVTGRVRAYSVGDSILHGPMCWECVVLEFGSAQSNMMCLQLTDILQPSIAYSGYSVLLAAPQLGPQARVGNAPLSDWQQEGQKTTT